MIHTIKITGIRFVLLLLININISCSLFIPKEKMVEKKIYIRVCPIYPKPSETVLKKIKSLLNKNVDNWMGLQLKLKKKLDLCKKD
jgi:hypothetical protein